MKKNKKIILLSLIIILTIFIFFKIFNFRNTTSIPSKISNLIHDNNLFFITTDSNLMTKYDIYWDVGNKINKKIFLNGEQISSMGNLYGKQIFTIYIDNYYIARITHIKTNNWYTHDYFINLTYDSIPQYFIIDFDVKGPNEFHGKYIFFNGDLIEFTDTDIED